MRFPQTSRRNQGIEVLKMNPNVGRGTRERGAILIQVAISILALTAFTAFVVDYGELWVARGQAQSAADAGALAGAIARQYDEAGNPLPANGGKTEQSALKAAACASRSSGCPSTPLANPATVASLVWPSEAGLNSTVAVDQTWSCPPGVTGKCARVDVYRNGENGSKVLPTFFGRLLGPNFSHGVKATASARIASANATNCMRPFAIPDRWTENLNVGTFDHWDGVGNALPTFDVYVPPTQAGFTGYKYPDDVTNNLLTITPESQPGSTVGGTGWSLLVSLPDATGGWLTGNNDTATIATCVGRPVKIGQYLPTVNGGTGQVSHYTTDLINQDASATWNSTDKTVNSTYTPFSPRIVPIAVFDIDEYQRRKNMSDRTPCIAINTGGQCVKIVNILGFFVWDTPTNGSVRGYLTSDPGLFVTGPPAIQDGASFLKVIQLVR
jgi:Flp pilus assembly protein TadG